MVSHIKLMFFYLIFLLGITRYMMPSMLIDILFIFLFNAVMAPQEKEEQQQPTPEVIAPDGGWGWVVVGALFVASALVFGLIRSLGIFFVEFVQYFGESAQAVSWITSIGVAVQQLFSKF